MTMLETKISTRATARTVGLLVIAAFFVYGIGSSIATSIALAGNAPGNPLFVVGAVMMILNSAIVIGIGILMFPILQPHNKNIALGYFATRVFEGTFLAIGALSLLSLSAIGREAAKPDADAALLNTLGDLAASGNFVAYSVAMAGLGFGSLFFTYLLLRSGLVPPFLAVWGFVGYALFALGCVLELFGVAGAGLLGAAPGGLFELFFGTWLITKGFRQASA
jgi:hypothetical protein